MSRTAHAMGLATALLGGTWLASPTHAQITDRTWGGGSNGALTSGDHLWSTENNWSANNVPDSGGGNGERAVIGSTMGDRNITTPGASTTIAQIQWTQSNLSTGINRITLGGDLIINHNVGASWTQTNATNDPSRMVLDLNGHRLSIAPNATMNHLTVIDSSGGAGELEAQLIQGGTGIIGPNVVYRQRASGQLAPGNLQWHPTSTAVITSGLTNFIQANAAALGNLQIGEPGGPTVHASLGNAFAQTMQGSVVIHSDGSNDANLTLVGNATFAVKGDFIDHAPATATNYGPSTTTIAFYGNPVTPSTISIARQLDNRIRVGDSGSEAGGLPGLAPSTGHVRLGQNLTTTGNVLVRSGSSLDLNNNVLTAGTLDLLAGSSLITSVTGLTAGTDYGQIVVDGTANINGANLVLGPVRGVNYGDVITLLTAGSINGTFAGLLDNSFVFVGGNRFATIDYSANAVTLTVLPEPGAVVVAALGLLLELVQRRRRT